MKISGHTMILLFFQCLVLWGNEKNIQEMAIISIYIAFYKKMSIFVRNLIVCKWPCGA